MTDAPLVLRVLSGPASGATKQLAPHARLVVGHEFWHDVVLRDASVRGSAVEIALDESGGARLTVLDGEAELLGATVAAGGSAVLPCFVPVRLGQVAFAWGQADSDRWQEAEALAASIADAPPPRSEQGAVMDVIASRWQAGPAGVSKRLRRPLLIGGVVAAVALLVVPPAVTAIQYGIGSEYKAKRVLTEAGYKRLKVDTKGGAVEITGAVPTEDDRLRIQRLLDAADVDARLQVQSTASLARAAADVARLNGVQVEARPQADGGVLLLTAPIDDGARNRLAQLVRRDVPALGAIRFSEELAIPRTVSEATKRVSSVVTGEPPYILTDDGARYFKGALLPSGYYLVGIEGNQVVLDRRGKKLALRF